MPTESAVHGVATQRQQRRTGAFEMAAPATSTIRTDGAGDSLLDIRDLTVRYRLSRDNVVPSLQQISFGVTRGESVGLLGESGSGKTTLALAMMGLLPRNAQVVSGSICLWGRNLTALGETGLRRVRGAEIALIPQEPTLALNPVIRVGRQIADVVRAHSSLNQRAARAVTKDLLVEVGLNPVDRIYDAFPHQLSGGQCQRVVTAQALICKPALLIADEPTSSLDQITQAEILALLQNLQRAYGFALLLITHDPRVIEQLVSRLLVLRGGCLVEQGSTRQMFASPRHAYTQSLLSCVGDD